MEIFENRIFFWKYLYVTILLIIPLFVYGQKNVIITNLSTDFLINPDRVLKDGYPINIKLEDAVKEPENYQIIGIGKKEPLLGWQILSKEENIIQKAYRVIVSKKKENIEKNIGDLWDTNKIESSNSINVRYSGKELKPNSIYYWKVKVWTNDGEISKFSKCQKFKTGEKLYKHYTSRYFVEKKINPLKSVKKINDQKTLIDFGRAAFGSVKLRMFANENNKIIKLYFGESIKSGSVDKNPQGNVVSELVNLKLKPGWNEYEIKIPLHHYNRPERKIYMPEYINEVLPFRYLEIQNYDYSLIKESKIEQIVVNYKFNDYDTYFQSDNKILNDLWLLSKYSVKATSFMGVYVDGNRERFPREGDSYVNQKTHYAVERGYSIARYTHEFQILYSSHWTDYILQVLIIAWEDYMHTGDVSSLNYFYNDLKEKTLHKLARKDGLISTKTGLVTKEILNAVHLSEIEYSRQKKENPTFRDLVDWPQKNLNANKESWQYGIKGETDDFDFRNINTVINSYHYQSLVIMSKISKILGYLDDYYFFKNRASKVKNSINRKLINPKSGLYIDGEGSIHSSLHANFLPLKFGIIPKKNLEKVIAFIKKKGMSCSPYGAQHLFDALYKSEQSEYGLKLLTSKGDRSWAHWIYDLGATITLEAWDFKFKPNMDWNHAWGSAPGNIIANHIMGIQPIKPGFEIVRIKPQIFDIKSAKLNYSTIRGEISMSIINDYKNFFSMDINIPSNMEAEIYFPKYFNDQKIKMNGKTIDHVEKENFLIVKKIGSGQKNFNIFR